MAEGVSLSEDVLAVKYRWMVDGDYSSRSILFRHLCGERASMDLLIAARFRFFCVYPHEVLLSSCTCYSACIISSSLLTWANEYVGGS